MDPENPLNAFEKKEHVPTREEVLELFTRWMKREYVLDREAYDVEDRMLTLLDEVAYDQKTGATTMISYTRKGFHGGQHVSSTTRIDMMDEKPGHIPEGIALAQYDEEKGEWEIMTEPDPSIDEPLH